MKSYVLMGLIGFLFLLGTAVLAQTSSDANPGLLPDHPLFVFQDFFERLQVFFAFGPEAKARVHIQLAEKRLAELNLAMEQNKTDLISRLSEKFERAMNETEDDIDLAESEGKNVTELAEHVAANTYKHILVLQRVMAKVSENARESIQHAIEQSSHGHDNAVEKILEHGNITGIVNITFTVWNQTFTQTFNVTVEEDKKHVEKESEHNETCRKNCDKPFVINKHNAENEDEEETGNVTVNVTTSTGNVTNNLTTTTTVMDCTNCPVGYTPSGNQCIPNCYPQCQMPNLICPTTTTTTIKATTSIGNVTNGSTTNTTVATITSIGNATNSSS